MVGSVWCCKKREIKEGNIKLSKVQNGIGNYGEHNAEFGERALGHEDRRGSGLQNAASGEKGRCLQHQMNGVL